MKLNGRGGRKESLLEGLPSDAGREGLGEGNERKCKTAPFQRRAHLTKTGPVGGDMDWEGCMMPPETLGKAGH